MIEVHSTATISKYADIEDSKRGSKIEIGSFSIIDSFVKIKPAGGFGNLSIGSHSVINSGCVLYTGNGIRIGNHVAVAANCTLAPVNHEYRSADLLISQQGFMPSRGGIIIEDDVWIGAQCVILDGSIIRRGCVVAAGSVVRGELEAYHVYAGAPLRVVARRYSTFAG